MREVLYVNPRAARNGLLRPTEPVDKTCVAGGLVISEQALQAAVRKAAPLVLTEENIARWRNGWRMRRNFPLKRSRRSGAQRRRAHAKCVAWRGKR